MNLAEVTKAYDFAGRSIVITGGAGTLGGEIARALIGCGARVAIVDRDLSPAENLLQRAAASPGQVATIHADVLGSATLERAAQKVLELFGRVDGLVNSAGGNKPEATTGPDRSFFDLSEQALREVMDLNILGPILPCRVFARHMVAQGEGEVVIYGPHITEVSRTHGALIDRIGYHVLDYFLKQWERFAEYPAGVIAHSTHLRGIGTYDAESAVESPRIRVTLATAISEEHCRRLNFGYMDPEAIRREDWRDREAEGILVVPKAGEML